ncbi:TPA: hypothetical protein N0F65_000656 [Lagenidium giganteum]|uniref:Uncharacterized protein n=1 Tax=Lagenidium giganteum TaxID=4803 RepID=A0AAV2YQP0_9STRA|nr:TPA: hypothetical protein N0F65_000656 [Lagenidium giganteum]
MPPSIRRLSEISTISIYNSDLIEWSKEAALTPDAFSIITYLQIVKSNLTEIPPGLLQELPRTLIDIQIIESAVPTAFPAVVSQRWANVTVLYVERCTLTDVPDAIMQLPKLDQLSLAHNNIHELPPHFFEATAIRTLRYLIMSANPLEALPTNLANASALLEMYLDQTDVAQLPASAFNSSLVVSAWNSTMCTSNAGGADDPRVNCHGLYGNIFRSGVYPLDPDIRAERVQNFLSDLVSN